jgi:predicted flap endonuclease-1-like 5' DNA nuclease
MATLVRQIILIMLGRQFIRLVLRGRISLVGLSRNIVLFTLSLATSILVGWLLIEEEETLRERRAMPMRSNEIELTDWASATDRGDDLTMIEGIGEGYARALRDAGIQSFSDLARQNPAELSKRLDGRVSATRIRNQDWIGQARQLTDRS